MTSRISCVAKFNGAAAAAAASCSRIQHTPIVPCSSVAELLLKLQQCQFEKFDILEVACT
jgi:hypothetical protein